MKIPVAKPWMDEAEERAAAEVVKSGWVTQGPKVEEFEKVIAEYIGASEAVCVTSCTTALHSALILSGIGTGDEVIVPSMSFIASTNSIVHTGAVPVFVDVSLDTCNMDIESIESRISNKTKAVMVVHQMGLPAALNEITEMARHYGLSIIEDAACAIGSAYNGKMIGSHGNMACFSFHPRKVITTGEGGAITTNDKTLAQKLRRLRHHGMSVSDIERHNAKNIILETYNEVGYNYRMTDIQAAIGLCQMEKLPAIIKKRREIAHIYNKKLSKIEHLRIPEEPGKMFFNNYQTYWIEVCANSPVTRNTLMERLLKRGISTRRGIMAAHREPCYSHINANLPNTERLTDNTIILPLYPQMKENEVQYVIKNIEEIFENPEDF